MSDRVYLTSTEVLAGLRSAFTSFDESARNGLASIDSEIEETRTWLLERKTHWQKEVAQAEQELSTAEANLRTCEASGYYDDDGDYVEPDCSSETDAVTDAQNSLSDARAKLDNVVQWEQRLDLGAQDFRRTASQFAGAVTHRTQERERFLDLKMKQYDAAAAISHRAELIATQQTRLGTSQLSLSQKVAQIDILGSLAEKQSLREALLKLAEVNSAGQLIDTLVDLGTQVTFAAPNELEDRGCWAVFDKAINRITLCQSLSDRPPQIIAPHLAHEATHAAWYRPSSIDQEYHAFKAQAEVWSALKNGLEDDPNDEVQARVGWGEHACKQDLRSWPGYSDYPESA